MGARASLATRQIPNPGLGERREIAIEDTENIHFATNGREKRRLPFAVNSYYSIYRD